MHRITTRISDKVKSALVARCGENVSQFVRDAIIEKLGLPAEEADPAPPNFSDSKAAKKASRKGVKARWGGK